MKYNCQNYYTLRTPVFSVNKLTNFLLKSQTMEDSDYVKYFLHDKEFCETLQVNSKETYEFLLTGKITKKLIDTLIKYYIRTTTRPTPFGLSAGVSQGKFSDNTEIIIKNCQEYKKKVCVDMDWITSLIKKLESDHEILKDLNIKASPQCYANGNRLINPYLAAYSKNNTDNEFTENSSIRYTRAVQEILQFCEKYQKVDDVLQYLYKKYLNISHEKIENMIHNLLENEIIISNLRFSIDETEPLETLITRIQNINKSYETKIQLTKINKLIKKYEEYTIGEGIDLYHKICKEMSNLIASKNYLQIDLIVTHKNNQLDLKMKSELEECINFLVRFLPGTNSGNSAIEEYKQDFIQKYGYERNVNLTKLLDVNMGLGLPAGYKKSNRKLKNNYTSNIGKMNRLHKLLNNAYVLGHGTIVLSEQDLKYITDGEDDENVCTQQSFDLFIDVLNHKDYQYAIAPAMSNFEAGQALGRFAYLFDKEFVLQNIKAGAKDFYQNMILAEVNEMPYKSRLSNVSFNYNSYEYSIPIAAQENRKKIVKLSDIYVGVDKISNKLYLKSQSLNKRVIVKRTNMLNPNFASNISKFLYEISYEERWTLNRIFAEFLQQDAIFSPRVVYKNIVLVPASWKIEKNDIMHYFNKNNISDLDIINFIKNWHIPNFVYLMDNDNRLFLDMNNKPMVSVLINTLKKKKKILLQEALQSSSSSIVTDEQGEYYFNEVVVSFLQKENNIQYEKNETKMQIQTCDYESGKLKECLLPGDEGWIYLKIYGCSGREDELIGCYMNEFCEMLYKERLIEQHFFIKYKDPDFHIRLRYKIAKSESFTLFMKKTLDWIHNLKKEGLVNTLVIDTYERESDRYGGIDLIPLAENVFCADSVVVEKIISQKYTNQLGALSDMYIGILSILTIMENCNFSLEKQIEILDRSVSKQDYRNVFKKNRDEIMRLCSMNRKLMNDEEINLLKIFDCRKEDLTIYMKKIEYKNLEKDEIILSLIHMFFNRFKMNNQWELEIRSITRHGLYAYSKSLMYKNKMCISVKD